MKFYSIAQWLLLLLVFLSACSAPRTGSVDKSQSGGNIIYVDNPISLTNLLIRLPGVRIDDFGPNTRVFVRGGAPLFVIDGMRIGYDFASVENAVNVNNIAAIELLTDPSETFRYGSGIQNGVIVIHTGIYDPDIDNN